MNPFVADLKAKLLKHPDHAIVTDTYLAVLLGDDSVFVIAGDFKNKSAEEVNQTIVDTLNNLM